MDGDHEALSGDRTQYRSSLTSMDDGEELVFAVEPTALQYGATRVDSEVQPYAYSHQIALYTGTTSERVTLHVAYVRGVLQAVHGWTRTQAIEQMEEFRRFVRAHLTATEQPDGILGGSPPSLHLEMPGRLSLLCDLVSVQWSQPDDDDYDQLGGLRRFEVDLGFREAPPERMTYQYLRTVGYRRW